VNPLVVVGVAGAVGLFALSKSSNAAAPAQGAGVLERMTAALATGDPATIRATAAQLRLEGYATQAADLERSALQLEQGVVPPSSASGSKVLKQGSMGPDVSAWQTFLRSQGYTNVDVDGQFGPQTADATKGFQRARGLTADGIVGPETLRASQQTAPAAVVTAPKPAAPAPVVTSAPPPAVVVTLTAPKYLQRGSSGPEVVAWQTFLQTQGFFTTVIDGEFGAQTADATKGFQRANALTADGIVGPETTAAAARAAAKGQVALPQPAPAAPAPAPAAAAAPAAAKTPAATPAAPAPAPAAARLLQQGTSGSDVSAWQTFLRSQGYTTVTVDGVFGPQTADATKGFQRARGLTADGIVGPETLRASQTAAPAAAVPAPAPAPAPALVVSVVVDPVKLATQAASVAKALGALTLRRDMTGSTTPILLWQLLLKTAGYTLTADGKFGAQTEDATKAFQRTTLKVSADGVVGPDTLRAVAALGASAVVAAAPAATPAPAPAAPTPSTSALLTQLTIKASAWRTLKRGTAGADVEEWQLMLYRLGYTSIVADGQFGAATETATKQWQASRGLTADGIVGPASVAALRSAPPPKVTVAGDYFASDSPLPGIIPAAAPPQVDVSPDRSLAAQLALHLSQTVPGSEDRALVEAFQRMQRLNPTGAYGPGTARALMRYGLVPAKPFYWPSQASQREKSNYRDALRREAAKDPTRAPEWLAAASRV
jgi:peptidoglycan hydrolase-like protein with peptidoglycan-binding domain